MRNLFFVILLIFSVVQGFSQELNARVQVSAQQIQGSTNKEVFRTLQKALFEFVNDRRWTNHVYAPAERIECTFQINISEQVSSDNYKGTMHSMLNTSL